MGARALRGARARAVLFGVTLALAPAPAALAQVPVPVPAGTFTAVSVKNLDACAIRTDATLACWGTNQYAPSASMPPAGTFRAVSAGYENSCGVRTDGTLACWGINTVGQSSPPAGTFTAVSAGATFACAIRTDATVACWGTIAAPPAGAFSAVSAGAQFACGLRTDATIACWGGNQAYTWTPPAGTFRSLSAWTPVQEGFVCAVSTAGSLACWGDMSALKGAPAPTGTFTTVSVGEVTGCAIRADQTLACWGYNVDGESTAPAGTFKAVSVAYHSACAIRTDQTLLCWPAAAGTAPPEISPAKAFSIPSSKTCLSRRSFTIHIRKLAGITWASAVVKVRGKRVKTIRQPRLSAPVDLTGLPKGRYTVAITATATDGRTVTGTRTYHTCASKHITSLPQL